MTRPPRRSAAGAHGAAPSGGGHGPVKPDLCRQELRHRILP